MTPFANADSMMSPDDFDPYSSYFNLEQYFAVRNMTGLNRKEFAEWLDIPYRTMQDWELGTSQVPEYVLRLVAYKVLTEKERGNL